jgi:hypothetical protein
MGISVGFTISIGISYDNVQTNKKYNIIWVLVERYFFVISKMESFEKCRVEIISPIKNTHFS